VKMLSSVLMFLIWSMASPVAARDFGQQGAVFGVLEQDLLKIIEQRLSDLQSSGGIDRMNKEFAARTEKKVRRPDPVYGVGQVSQARSWIYDPAIEIDHDVTDTKGNMIARKGQRVNPLDFIVIKQALVFIDGDDPVQVEWATKYYSDLRAKLVIVRGAPLELMTKHQRRFYFDQGGSLVERFGIRAVPAVVVQEGRVMRVREVPMAGQKKP
jgi:conjugal transfer pilus assembly protein TraW